MSERLSHIAMGGQFVRDLTAADRGEIVVGRALPCSIYGHDRTLLLAAGKVVPNDFVREGLLRAGVFCGEESTPARQAGAAEPTRISAPMEALQRAYRETWARAQVGFRMQQEGQATVYSARPVGATEAGALIMSGPIAADGKKVPIAEGATWTFRALYAVAALRFDATISRAGIQSDGYFNAENIRNVERRNVRKWPRVATCIEASREGETQRLILDFSVGGARLAAEHHLPLERGQEILINTKLKVLEREHPLTLEAVVLNMYGAADPDHPKIRFYGVQFEKTPEPTRLLIHAYVQETLCMDLDRVAHVFSIAAL